MNSTEQMFKLASERYAEIGIDVGNVRKYGQDVLGKR